MRRQQAVRFSFAALVITLFVFGFVGERDARHALESIIRTSEFRSEQRGTSTKTITVSTVVRVIDGDTIVLENGERVRYIGIDAPELAHDGHPAECYAMEAKQRNDALVLGRTVTLKKDTEDKDRYGRTLRFVEVNGIDVNLTLVSEGYARRIFVAPNVGMQDALRAAEENAKITGAGLWGACKK